MIARKHYGETDFITGLRAFAALSVGMIHAGGAGLREFGAAGNALADLGKAGVYVFFVISGYSVSASFKQSGSYGQYLNKRIWRLAPLYYFWIIAAVAFEINNSYWLEKFSVSIDTYNILMHMFFIGFFDYRITNSILGVEWSLSIEFFWYLLLPFIAERIVTNRQSFYLIATSFIAYWIFVKHGYKLFPFEKHEAKLAMHWSPLPYCFSYCAGIAAYKIRESTKKSINKSNTVLFASLLTIFLYANYPNEKIEYFMMTVITFFMITYEKGSGTLISRLFASRPMVYLGTISYGIYLSHMPVMIALKKAGIIEADPIAGGGGVIW